MKKFAIKFYSGDESTDFSGTLPDQKANGQVWRKNEIRFSQSKNGGQKELILSLNSDLDSLPEYIDLEHRVKVFEIDSENPKGRLIYSGVISKINPKGGESDEVSVSVLGKISFLARGYYKSGSSFAVFHSEQDPKDIFSAILDHFDSVYPNVITDRELDRVGVDISYDFENVSWLEAINEIMEIVGDDFYFFLDCSGKFWFKQKSSSAIHKFVFGDSLEEFEAPRSTEEIINSVSVVYSGGSVSVEDSDSILAYGVREFLIENSQISDSASAEKLANEKISGNKNPMISPTLWVNHNYDIEAVIPGETCKVLNVAKGSVLFYENMQIDSITYSENSLRLSIASEVDDFVGSIVGLAGSVSQGVLKKSV